MACNTDFSFTHLIKQHPQASYLDFKFIKLINSIHRAPSMLYQFTYNPLNAQKASQASELYLECNSLIAATSNIIHFACNTLTSQIASTSQTTSTLDSLTHFLRRRWILFLQHAWIIRTSHNNNTSTTTTTRTTTRTTTTTTTTIWSASRNNNNIAQSPSPSSAHILRAPRSASRSCYISTPAPSLSIRISVLCLSVECRSLSLCLSLQLCVCVSVFVAECPR